MSRYSYSSRSNSRDAEVCVEEGLRLVSLLPDYDASSCDSSHANFDLETDTPTGNENYVDYSSFTVSSLRQELKKRDLPQNGIKRALIVRLQEDDDQSAAAMAGGRVRGRKKNAASSSSNADQNGDAAGRRGSHQSPNKGRYRNKATSRQSSPSTMTTTDSHQQRMAAQKERGQIVLWRRPLLTLYYFLLEGLVLVKEFFEWLWRFKKTVLFVLLTFLILFGLYHTDGSHQKFVLIFREQFLWCAYWVGLGILSSVGLGTGLHTFLLYLGPHIAAVTLAAFECMSVDFPAPPYPNDIICPEEEGPSMSLWTIMSKVRLEAFMWGAGTAIGELPPYFMARAARLSGQMDEEEAEIEELIHEKQEHPSELSFLDRGKIVVHDMVQRVGFMGILLCASIPNPLFDLAGITCGHFLVPFWTFFGATLIGKAIIKMHIQKLFVIFVFSEKHVEHVVHLLKYLPYGKSLQAPFKEYLQKQKAKLHHKPGTDVASKPSWLSWVFEKVVLVMVAYFILSIINSMAQSYHKRITSPPSPSPSPSKSPATSSSKQRSRKVNQE